MVDQETEPKASITNICYDCLERIFDFLTLEDLLCVANTCKRLQIAAAAKFGDEYGKRRICIRIERETRNEIRIIHDDIFIVGSKFQLPFLRCFGEKNSHYDLQFCVRRAIPSVTVLSQYVNQYCADTLTTFACHVNHEPLLIEKPFKNVEKLEISGRAIGRVFRNFVNWFPSLRHLDMRNIVIYRQCMAVNVPNLEHLNIPVRAWTIQHTTDFLNANLQLQSLDIHIDEALRLTTVLNMIRGHQLISKLNVKLDYTAQVSAAELGRLANEHPLMVELIFRRCLLTEDNVIALIGQLSSLKKFEFRIQGEAEFNRLRYKMNGEWHFECENLGGSVYVIVLNRKH